MKTFRLPLLILALLSMLSTKSFAYNPETAETSDEGGQGTVMVLFYKDSGELSFTYYSPGSMFARPVGIPYFIIEGAFSQSAPPEWSKYAGIKKAVITPSMANYIPRSTACWFYNLTELETIEGLENLNTGEVTDMSYMFGFCDNLRSIDVSSFTTWRVTSMEGMFYACTGLETLKLGNLYTSNVVNMSSMFASCSSLKQLDLSSFNTAKVTSMRLMFNGCDKLETIYAGSGWTIEGLVLSSFMGCYMFGNCSALTGGMGTKYSYLIQDYNLARIDGGSSSPGYFTGKSAAVAYSVLNDGVLTFYYDSQKDVRTGKSYAIKTKYESPTHYQNTPKTVLPEWHGDSTLIKKVIFDASFARYTPNSLSCWFYGCRELQSIEGLGNLNTSNVIDLGEMFLNCESLSSLDLRSLDTRNVKYMDKMFCGCKSLASLNLSSFNTSRVIWMSQMFSECESLTELDVSAFDTQNVVTMGMMFGKCSSLRSLDLSNFNTGKTEDMSSMFWHCLALEELNVSSFNTSNVTLMEEMFEKCKSLRTLDLSSFNTEKVKTMSLMFRECESLTSLNISSFRTPNLETMEWMFSSCRKLKSIDVSHFNTSKVRFMGLLFNLCQSLETVDVSHFNTSNVTNMNSMFSGCSRLKDIDLSHFNTSKVTRMNDMFRMCESLAELDVSSFDTRNVKTMKGMFYNCRRLPMLDLQNFETPQVTDMDEMFYYSSNLTTIYVSEKWTTDKVENGSKMFTGCIRLVGGCGTKYDSNHQDYDYAHIDEGSINPGYLTFPRQTEAYAIYNDSTLYFYYDNLRHLREGVSYLSEEFRYGFRDDWGSKAWTTLANKATASIWDIKKIVFDESFKNYDDIISTSSWFNGCEKLEEISGLDNLNTRNVTDMNRMFFRCTSLPSLDLTHFDTSNVTDMHGMFYDCYKLATLDLSHFNTSNVTDMDFMFTRCQALDTIDISNFDTHNVVSMQNMFTEDNLTHIKHNIDTQNAKNLQYMFSRCHKLESLDVSKFDTRNAETIKGMFQGCNQLKQLDVSHFQTEKLVDATEMFAACSSLKELDLSSFNTRSLRIMDNMFMSCSELNTIYCSEGWNLESVDSGTGMFLGCKSLIGGQGTVFSSSHTGLDYAHIDGGPSNPGYFTYKEYVAPVGINAPAVLQHESEEGVWYTPQGIRVAAPSKGLYIRRGKKIYIK